MNKTSPSTVNTGNSFKLAILIAFHIPLGLAMYRSSLVATAHALFTLIIVGAIGLTTREPRKAAWAAAYVIGADVLWRMTDARVFYEIGKYATIAVLGLCFVRMPKKRGVGLPLAYIFLLLLSTPLTLTGMELGEARKYLSSTLSGPLCLAVSVMFFSQISVSLSDRKTIAWLIAAPLMAIGTITTYSIVTAEEIFFTTESNFVTSGGFGPNQVSAVLGLGALLLLMVAIQDHKSRWIAAIMGLALLTLSVITFSRGGLYNVVVALLCAATVFMRDARLRTSFLGILVIGLLVGGFWIYPQLNEFTGGMVTTRFSDTDTTNRVDIMQVELNIWLENPILGTGPGMGKFDRYEQLGFMTASHTEYTRMISEHGIPGIFAIILLLVMSAKSIRQSVTGLPLAWVMAMLAWPLVEMTHAAMRIAAIGFIFGFAFIGHSGQDHQKEMMSPRQAHHLSNSTTR